MIDRVVAGVLLVLSSPVLAVRAFLSRRDTGRVFEEERALDVDGNPIVLRRFAGRSQVKELPLLLSIARGDMRFVGPRPRPAGPAEDATTLPLEAHGHAPGLFSSHRLRTRTGIAYQEEYVSGEFDNPSLLAPSNWALIARTVVAHFLGAGARHAATPERFELLGVHVDNLSMDEALGWIFRTVRAGGPARQLAFINPACLNTAFENGTYAQVLDRCDLVAPDGIGVRMAAQTVDVRVRENVNGTDMFPLLCERAAAEGVSIYLLGARPGVARAAADEMVTRYPGLRVAGARDGYFPEAETAGVVREINDSGAGILLVAFGVPKQELWIDAHLAELTPPVCMGVGGLFDFYSGRIPRAPMWIREIGFEWTWRLAREPRRMWRRYVIGNPLFLYRVRRSVAGQDRGAGADAVASSRAGVRTAQPED